MYPLDTLFLVSLHAAQSLSLMASKTRESSSLCSGNTQHHSIVPTRVVLLQDNVLAAERVAALIQEVIAECMPRLCCSLMLPAPAPGSDDVISLDTRAPYITL